MNYLLDTHIFLWSLNDSHQLKPLWKDIISNSENEIYVSVVSLWETIIKANLKKLDIEAPYYNTLLEGIQVTGFGILSLMHNHIEVLESLENLHRDPFDRILISQAVSEDLVFITDDTQILKYSHVKTL